jgi:hypothetical protein
MMLVLIVVLGCALPIVGLARGWSKWIAIASCAVVVALGWAAIGAYFHSLDVARRAIAFVDPTMKVELLGRAVEESYHELMLRLLALVVPAIATAALLMRRRWYYVFVAPALALPIFGLHFVFAMRAAAELRAEAALLDNLNQMGQPVRRFNIATPPEAVDDALQKRGPRKRRPPMVPTPQPPQ